MSELHRIVFTSDGSSTSAHLWFDGKEILASKFEFSCGVDGLPTAITITLPIAAIQIDTLADVKLVQPLTV